LLPIWSVGSLKSARKSCLYSAVRLANPIIYKDDSYDAYCVARVLRDMVDTLQDAKHEDIFWTIRQIVKRRDLIVKGNVMNKNQLHS